MSNSNQVSKLYGTVVEDVINNVKEAFLDEGIDEQVLQDLKQLWESKLAASKALEPSPVEQEITYPPQNIPVMLPQPIQASNQQQRQVPIHSQNQKVQPVQAPQFQQPGAASVSQPGTIPIASGLFQQQITALGAGGQMQNITVQQTGNGQYITVAGLSQLSQLQQLQQQQVPQQINIQQPQQIQLQQQHQQKLLQPGTIIQQNQTGHILAKGQMVQLDGPGGDSSSSDDEDFDDGDDKEEEAKDDLDEEEQAEEEEPLNTDDDISEEDPTELFDAENVVVCQYDKINRNRNKWKFHLKDGIMSLNGRDFVFQKATGDSEW